jgi:hypothetical protein
MCYHCFFIIELNETILLDLIIGLAYNEARVNYLVMN